MTGIWLAWARWLATDDVVNGDTEFRQEEEARSSGSGIEDEDEEHDNQEEQSEEDAHDAEEPPRKAARTERRLDDAYSPTSGASPHGSCGEEDVSSMSSFASASDEPDNVLQAGPALLKSFLLFQEVLASVVDVTIPSEESRAIFDAGAPADILHAGAAPECGWEVFNADLARLPMASSSFSELSQSFQETGTSRSQTIPRRLNLDELAEAVASEARTSAIPLAVLIAEGLATILAALLRLIPRLARSASSSRGGRVARRRASFTANLRMVFLEACTDRRIQF
jgi:hypothetical protein